MGAKLVRNILVTWQLLGSLCGRWCFLEGSPYHQTLNRFGSYLGFVRNTSRQGWSPQGSAGLLLSPAFWDWALGLHRQHLQAQKLSKCWFPLTILPPPTSFWMSRSWEVCSVGAEEGCSAEWGICSVHSQLSVSQAQRHVLHAQQDTCPWDGTEPLRGCPASSAALPASLAKWAKSRSDLEGGGGLETDHSVCKDEGTNSEPWGTTENHSKKFTQRVSAVKFTLSWTLG